MYRFDSYKELKSNLGSHDAMIEVNELAFRSFVHQAEKHGNARKFVEENSKRYHVCVNVSDLSTIQSKTRLSYIVTVYQSADLFYRQFGSEHAKLYDKPWSPKLDNEAPLQHVIRNLACSSDVAHQKISSARIALFEYYRRMRNHIVHPSSAPREDRYSFLRSHLGEIHKMYSTLQDAPHQMANVDFDDFILFSRLVKDIAAVLCELAAPSDEELEMAARKHAVSAVERFSNVSNNHKRMECMVASELMFKFGLDLYTAKTIASCVVAH